MFFAVVLIAFWGAWGVGTFLQDNTVEVLQALLDLKHSYSENFKRWAKYWTRFFSVFCPICIISKYDCE
jgi:hypothetical protein